MHLDRTHPFRDVLRDALYRPATQIGGELRPRVDMLVLLPSELPMFAPISFAASISIEPGMKMPACPSLSNTSSSTGMMLL